MTKSRRVDQRPRVVFVCVKNGGKSQMAARLMRKVAGDAVEVDSAGTSPGTEINSLSAQVLHEIGLDISTQVPKALTPDTVAGADLVVTLGGEAVVEPVVGTAIVNWDIDEPSERGIQGIKRMRLVRDDIAARVDTLAAEVDPCAPTDSSEPAFRAVATISGRSGRPSLSNLSAARRRSSRGCALAAGIVGKVVLVEEPRRRRHHRLSCDGCRARIGTSLPRRT